MIIGTLPFDRIHEFPGFITYDTADMLTYAPNSVLLAATENEEPVGLLAALCDFNELHIVSLYVANQRRFRGIGTALIDALALGSELMRGWITCAFFSEEPVAFFSRAGFSVTPDREGAGKYITTLNKLSALPFWRQDTQPDKQIVPLGEVNDRMLVKYLTRFQISNESYMPPFSLTRSDGELSHALVIGGEIQGIAVCARRDEELEVLWIHFSPNHLKLMPALMRTVYRAACERLNPDAPVYFHTIQKSGRQLAEKLTVGAEFIPKYEASAPLNALRVPARTRQHKDRLPAEAPEWFIKEIGGA